MRALSGVTLALTLLGRAAQAQDTIHVERMQEAALRTDPRAGQRELLRAATDQQIAVIKSDRLPQLSINGFASYQSDVTPAEPGNPRSRRPRPSQAALAVDAGCRAAHLRRRRGRQAARAGGGAACRVAGRRGRGALRAALGRELRLLLGVPSGQAGGGVRRAGGGSGRAVGRGARAGRRWNGSRAGCGGDRGGVGAGRRAAERGAGLPPGLARDPQQPGRASGSTRPPSWCCRPTSPR